MMQWKPSIALPPLDVPVLGYWKANSKNKEHWGIVLMDKPDVSSWLVCDGGVYDVWTHCDEPDFWFDLPEVEP